MKKYLLILLAMVAISLQTSATPSIDSVTMIWDKAPYNSFTDLIYFQDQFFCCFRESNSHQDGENGKIRILVSPDAVKWKSVALLALKGYDLRDPKLSETPDGKLLLNMGATIWGSDGSETINSAVSFSSNGKSWDTVQVLPYKGQWLWHVAWNGGTAYAAAYSSTGTESTALSLMSSTDGITYTNVLDFDIADNPTEATLQFSPNQRMTALIRRNNGPGLIGSSLPPYDTWTWFDTNSVLGGPDFLILPDGKMWASSRETSGTDETCILARMSLNRYDPVLTLPSSGDCSYPGMVYKDGKLYISYYASQTGKACIYLAVIKL